MDTFNSTKSNALLILKAFVQMVETQFETKVKNIRSDNGFDLGLSQEAKKFFIEKGILHRTTCVYTPQQNGVVEKKHKHLLETSYALLFQSQLPLKYWRECVLTATYLINRFPSKLLKNKTPYEILFKRKPDYSSLRNFGCLCYITPTDKHIDKLQPRAIACAFLGYIFGKKGLYCT